MKRSLTIAVVIFVGQGIFAQTPTVHTIEKNGIYLPVGHPRAIPEVKVFGGKTFRMIWKDATAVDEADLTVHRITDARRISVVTEKAFGAKEEWSWEWKAPITRGSVIYEVSLNKEGVSPVRLEVRNFDEHRDQMRALQSMTWEASQLDRVEIDALAALGFRILIKNEGLHTPPMLRMIVRHALQSRRVVRWTQNHPHTVVWRVGPSATDMEISAPRWWISAEALATDEGSMRLIDLFTTAP